MANLEFFALLLVLGTLSVIFLDQVFSHLNFSTSFKEVNEGKEFRSQKKYPNAAEVNFVLLCARPLSLALVALELNNHGITGTMRSARHREV